MASAMRKMAVYLGLVEDDHRYDDHYQDEYGTEDEYDEYGTDLVAQEDRPVAYLPGSPRRARPSGERPGPDPDRPIWPGSRPCIPARTMRHVRSESISARALR